MRNSFPQEQRLYARHRFDLKRQRLETCVLHQTLESELERVRVNPRQFPYPDSHLTDVRPMMALASA